jgi:hypothetical protein
MITRIVASHLKLGAERGVIAALCLFIGIAPLARSYAQCAEVFDSTAYKNKPNMQMYGIKQALTINPLRWWAPGESLDKLTASKGPEHWATSSWSGDVVVLDLERWPTIGDPVIVSATLQRLSDLVKRLKAVGISKPIGYYGMLPNRDYWRAIKAKSTTEYSAWQRENDLLRSLAVEIDSLFPSLYTFYDDVLGWKAYAIANLSEARRLSMGKPVYAFLWPEYHDSNKSLRGQFIPGSYWAIELETAAQYADGIVIWGGWDNGPRSWDENAAWWTATKAFMAKQSKNCPSTAQPRPPANMIAR